VLEAYRDLVPTAPDALYVDFDLEASPDAGTDVSVSCVYRGSEADARRALAPLFDAVEPSKIQLATRTFGSFLTEYAETILQGQLQVWKSAFLRQKFDAQTVDTIVDHFGRAPRQSSPVLFIETVGGAVSRADPSDSAYPHRHELMCLTFIGVWDDVAQTAANDEWARQFRAALTPGTTGGVYVNYADAELENWPAAYYGGSYKRLVQVKRQYDPGNLFRFP